MYWLWPYAPLCQILAQSNNLWLSYSDLDWKFVAGPTLDFTMAFSDCATHTALTYQTRIKSSNPRLVIWPNNLEHVSHVGLRSGMIVTKLKSVNLCLPDLRRFHCWRVMSCCDLDLWPLHLERLYAVGSSLSAIEQSLAKLLMISKFVQSVFAFFSVATRTNWSGARIGYRIFGDDIGDWSTRATVRSVTVLDFTFLALFRNDSCDNAKTEATVSLWLAVN